jgi:adenylate kinase family enzyme
MPAFFRRVAVVGGVGCGKTTLAKEIARRIDAPHIELDEFRYNEEWVETDEKFRPNVVAFVGTDKWVIDGNYAEVQDLIWIRAQLLVWIDFELPVVLWRLLRRTLRRLWTREEFANNNREQLKRVFSNRSILIWAIRSHGERRRRYEELLKHERYAHLQVVRLRSPSAVSAWVAGLPKQVKGAQIETK